MGAQGAEEEGALDEVLELVARGATRDLREYARSSHRARVLGRMSALGLADLREYALRLREDPGELDALAGSLLNHSTGFFRDPAVYRTLEEVVVPALRRRFDRRHPLRAWSIGCATGEEAWSLGVVLAEVLPPGEPFEVLATDLDPGSLARAREARYTARELESAPARLRGRWFVPDSPHREVVTPRPELRERTVFAIHDLVGPTLAPPEAVLGSFHLVTCRNLLLYLEPRLREKASGRLASLLLPGGVLVLGLGEEQPGQRFRPFPGVDPALRLFERLDADEAAA